MGALAAKIDLTIQAGATWDTDAVKYADKASGTPINLTGYEARMQIRASVTDVTIVMTLTTANGKLILTPLLGRIDFRLSAVDTTTLSPAGETIEYVYGVEVFNSAVPEKVISLCTGKVTVSPEVVR